jgi:hypothetical protein
MSDLYDLARVTASMGDWHLHVLALIAMNGRPARADIDAWCDDARSAYADLRRAREASRRKARAICEGYLADGILDEAA